ncbi:sulfotransferase [Novipirellula sp.]|uniref:sulfotransferase family protein n=1 Tax=Novipirellula sp. TaxID=2795430 RepID=UPI00356B1605
MEITIILSSPRSGSSWLSRVVRCIPDHSVFTHNTYTTQFLYSLYPIKSVNPFGDDGIGDPGWLASLLKPWRVRRVRSYIESRAAGKPIVLISPTLSNFLPLLKEAFPDARYVHFQRNPLDTIASMKKFLAKNDCGGFIDRYRAHAYGGRIFAMRSACIHTLHRLRWMRLIHRGYLGVRPGGFQDAARYSLVDFLSWYYTANQRDILDGLADIPASRQVGIHYEKLVEHYDEEVAKLLNFMIGDKEKPEIPHSHDGVRSGAVGRCNELFDDNELELIRSFLRTNAPKSVLQTYRLETPHSVVDEQWIKQETS